MSEPARRARLPFGVIALGLVSLFMDVSSEMIHALFPIFLVQTLGASTAALGAIEGVAEATASFTKLGSGWLSDVVGRRKPLVVLGYGLAAATKPVFALATSLGVVVAARWVDRVGKGIRGAPRDALVADIAPPEARGAAFGLRQALDSVGAVVGPLTATLWLVMWPGDVRGVFAFAVVPAMLALAILVLGVREPERARVAEAGAGVASAGGVGAASASGAAAGSAAEDGAASAGGAPRVPLRFADLRGLDRRVRHVLIAAAVLGLARCSEAFLILRATSVGLDAVYAPLLMVAMNLAHSASSYPFGRLADGGHRRRLLVLGAVLLAASELALAVATHPLHALAGTLLWGLHLGATQGVMAAWLADVTPAHLRGSAFGALHAITGVAALLSSALVGALWQWSGPPLAFATTAALALLFLPLGSRRFQRFQRRW